MLYLDLAEIDRLALPGWLWSTRRSALVRFRRQDHFGEPALSLDEAVRQEVERHTGSRPAGPIRLLTHARIFGYVFNPISIYYCFSKDNELESLLLEVMNIPWGERHCYVLTAQEVSTRAWRKTPGSAKALHVSPFLPMEMAYRFFWSPPGNTLTGHIECLREGENVLDATLCLKAREFTSRELAGQMIRHPWMTLRVVAAIHGQALRLWWKGLRVFDHPEPATERTS
jgi:DUF1365 family protein